MPRPLRSGQPRAVTADQLSAADIGSRVLVRIDPPDARAFTLAGVLSDVETQPAGVRLAHVAVHPDGRLCTGATTARAARVAVYAGGLELLLPPGHPLLVAG